MQEILIDKIDCFSSFEVLIVNNFNLEYFYLAKKVVIHDTVLFELRTIIGSITMGNFKWCGHIFILIMAHNLVVGGLTNICRMYQYKQMIHQTTFHTTIRTPYNMFVLMMLMWI